jgi:hypothetical protein
MGFKPGSTEVMGDWSPTEKVAIIEAFDTTGLKGVSSDFNLNLSIRVLDWTEPGLNAPVAGAFTFNFTVPVHPGTVINVNQTVEAAGYTFTLDKVLISPWETRAVIRF